MKITINESFKTTLIEADARELRESNTLGDNFAMFLSRAFQSHEPFDDEPINDEPEEEAET